MPTKANLVARGIISQEAQVCVTECWEVETAHHLFFSCSVFWDLWHSVRGWIGVSGVDLHIIPDHFLQLTYSTGGSATRRSFMQLIWLLCVWYCGMNVIIEFLATRKIIYTNCWIKLNFTRTGGWRQLMPFCIRCS